jgi:hypothetical protein
MKTIDEFGKDPTVQRTRTLFAMMEKMEKALLERLNLSPFDKRLRIIRDMRQHLYEKSFSIAIDRGLYMNEEAALELFAHCQKIAATKCGFDYKLLHEENPKIAAIIQEAMP